MYPFLLFFQRERGEGREKVRERNNDVTEKHQSAAFHTRLRQGLGAKPTTQACVLTRNWTGTPSRCGTVPKQMSHTSQGSIVYTLKTKNFCHCTRSFQKKLFMLQSIRSPSYYNTLELQFSLLLQATLWFFPRFEVSTRELYWSGFSISHLTNWNH